MAAKSTRSVILSFFWLFAIVPRIAAADPSAIEEGINYYRQENYDEAILSLQEARKEDPTSSLAAYYTGITYKKLQDYKNARSNLIDAVSLTPKVKEALIELVDVLYQLGDLGEAKKYIETAEKENIKPAETAFLKGMVLMKEGDEIGAVAAFKKAKELDGALTQAADYQIGLAYLKDQKFDEAQGVFKDVVVLDPNSNLADFAKEYVGAIQKKKETEKPLRLSFGAYGEYDTNVVLKPSDTTVAANVTDEADWREVYTFQGSYRLKISDKFGLTPQYSLYRAHQNDLGILNITSHTLTAIPDYYLDKGTIGLPLAYNYTDVGEKKYLTTISAAPTLNYAVGRTKMAQLLFRYQKNDFSRPPVIPDEERDSNYYAGGIGLYHMFADNKGFFGLRYELNRDDTKGVNWKYLGNKIDATALYPFNDKLKASLAGEVFLQDFDNTNTVFRVKRKDRVYTASGLLSYNFWKNAEFQLRYTFVKDSSNITVYDYDRNIYSFGFQYNY